MEPTSEHDWTIHSLNIHGVFFERWCAKVVSEASGWKIKSTNFPVEFPPPNGPFRGKESSLDIWAVCQSGDSLLSLLIECKKNNPDFVNWIFFKKPDARSLLLSEIENEPRETPPGGWGSQPRVRVMGTPSPLADEGRETRASYADYKKGNKTKTSNAAITEASYQVALATQAIHHEEANYSRLLGSRNPPVPLPFSKQVFLPTIVTSAHLFACDFNPADVSAAAGEIPYDKVTRNECSHLFFEYALPRHLQMTPQDLADALLKGSLELFIRKHILVVHGASFSQVLQQLPAELIGSPKPN